MASSDIRGRIAREREQIEKAKSRIVVLNRDRSRELEAGNDSGVDAIEAEISSAETSISRGEERLELLSQRLTESEREEEKNTLIELTAQADKARQIGERLIADDYRKQARALAATLAKLFAIDDYISIANERLHAAKMPMVNGPNIIRCIPTQKIERTKIKRESICNPNVVYDQHNIPPTKDVEVRYMQRIPGYFPDQLTEAVRLPGVTPTETFWPLNEHSQELKQEMLKALGIGQPSIGTKIKALIGGKAA